MLALVDGVPAAAEPAAGARASTSRTRSRSSPGAASTGCGKARDRAHIVEGLLKALDMIDAIITLIRGSESADAAKHRVAWPRRSSSARCRRTHILDMPLRRLAALERQKLRDEFDELADDDRRARGDPRRRAEAARRHQGRARRDPRQVRRRAPHARSPPTPATSPTSTSSRTKSSSSCCRRSGYVKTVSGRPVPRAGPRRQGRARRQPPRRGLRRAPAHHHRALVPVVLLEPRPRLPPARARDPDEGPHRARHRAREPRRAAARRAHRSDHRHAHLRRRRLPVLRDPQRHGEEDADVGVRLVAAQRPDRDQPQRRRRAGAGHPDDRHRRRVHGVAARA